MALIFILHFTAFILILSIDFYSSINLNSCPRNYLYNINFHITLLALCTHIMQFISRKVMGELNDLDVPLNVEKLQLLRNYIFNHK